MNTTMNTTCGDGITFDSVTWIYPNDAYQYPNYTTAPDPNLTSIGGSGIYGAGTYWPTTTQTTLLPLTKVGKADILANFFGPDLHALMYSDDSSNLKIIQFMDKFGLIWISLGNEWLVYNRDAFLEFVHSDATIFLGTPLTKQEILKLLMNPVE